MGVPGSTRAPGFLAGLGDQAWARSSGRWGCPEGLLPLTDVPCSPCRSTFSLGEEAGEPSPKFCLHLVTLGTVMAARGTDPGKGLKGSVGVGGGPAWD